MLQFRYGLLLVWLGLSFVIGPVQLRAQSGNCARLVWADEFDNTGAPDAARWNFETGGGGWGNNELQIYTDNRNNSYVSNGTLKIHARKTDGTWTSARMVTSGKASWKYGRFEIKARLPLGKGTWPALWMMPQQSVYGTWPKSGEIDIMEHVGYDPGRVYGTVHTEAYNHKNGTQKGGNTLVANVNSEFHVYAIEWSETEIKWFVDDKLYFTFVNENKTYREWPFDQPFFLIFNIAIGGDWGGAQGIDPALTEAVMEIDYVRVYSKTIAKPVISGPSLVQPGQQATFSTAAQGDLQYRWLLPEGVTEVSGGATNTITVNWNDRPGQVRVEVFSPCETVASDPFEVGILGKPAGEYWPIPITGEGGALLWSAVAGAGNQISLRVENGELVVTFNIQSPSENPYIVLNLPQVTDLRKHREMMLQLMAQVGQAPSNMRLDLLDINLQNDLTDLFKIDNPTADGQFHPYQRVFSMNASGGYQPDKIRQIRIYFNYGILGQKGAGEFRLKELKMHDPNFTSATLPNQLAQASLYPNPAAGQVELFSSRPFSAVILTAVSGQIVKKDHFSPVNHRIIDLHGLAPGIYLVTVWAEGQPAEYFKMVKQ